MARGTGHHGDPTGTRTLTEKRKEVTLMATKKKAAKKAKKAAKKATKKTAKK